MHLLIALAACSCALLVGVAAALWRSIRQEEQLGYVPKARSFAEAMRQVGRQPRPHPRMDLAAGTAIGTAGPAQRVDAPRGRVIRSDSRDATRLEIGPKE